jgi:hypothetical protein
MRKMGLKSKAYSLYVASMMKVFTCLHSNTRFNELGRFSQAPSLVHATHKMNHFLCFKVKFLSFLAMKG